MPDEPNPWPPDEVAALERAEAVHDVRQWLTGEIPFVDWPTVLPHVLAELDRLRSSVAAVRVLHHLDERQAQWGREVCAGCATHVTFTPWPCATIKALDLAVSGLGHIPGEQP